MRIFLALCIFPALVLAQDYYEAFGQTVPFTLAAGAKAAWDNHTLVTEKSPLCQLGPVSMALYPNPCNGSPHFTVNGAIGPARIVIYNVNGQKMENIILNKKREAGLSRPLPNGIYFARLHVNGRPVQTTSFLAVR